MNLNIGTLNLNDYGPLSLRDLVGTLPAGERTDATPDVTQCPNCGQSLEWCDCAGEWEREQAAQYAIPCVCDPVTVNCTCNDCPAVKCYCSSEYICTL